MLRYVWLFLFVYLFWRILRSLIGRGAPPPQRRAPSRPQQHAADFSDVQDADFEDLTPPKQPSDPKN